MSTPVAPPLEYVAHFSVDVGAPIDLGELPDGHRRLVPILGGRVTGPRLAGTVLPVGADHQSLRSATLTELDATYAVRTHDGALIRVRNSGIRAGDPADIAALIRGEDVDPDRIYFRTQPRLSTAERGLDWLNNTLFVASGVRTPASVELDVFAVR